MHHGEHLIVLLSVYDSELMVKVKGKGEFLNNQLTRKA